MTFREGPRVGALGRPGLTRLIKAASGWGARYLGRAGDGKAGEQSTKHRGKGGGPTLPELPDQLRGGCPLRKICIPDLADWQIPAAAPSAAAGALTHSIWSVRINQSFNQSAWATGEGEGEGEEEGGLRVGRGGGSGALGAVAWTDWTGLDWPGGRLPQGAGTGTGRCARVGQEPCPPMRHPSTLHPAPWSWATSLAPPPTVQLPSRPTGTPHIRLMSLLGRPGNLGCSGIHPPCSLPKPTSDQHILHQSINAAIAEPHAFLPRPD